jgi:hypothetical protein
MSVEDLSIGLWGSFVKCVEESMSKDEILKLTLEKWKRCKRRDCKINVTNSWNEMAKCNMCENFWESGALPKKTFSEWIRTWKRK